MYSFTPISALIQKVDASGISISHDQNVDCQVDVALYDSVMEFYSSSNIRRVIMGMDVI